MRGNQWRLYTGGKSGKDMICVPSEDQSSLGISAQSDQSLHCPPEEETEESVIFHNEYQVYAHCDREPGETLQQWQIR